MTSNWTGRPSVDGPSLVFRHGSLVSTEGRDAPAWPGATTENIEHI